MQVTIYGKASGKKYEFTLREENFQMSVLDFLLAMKIPMAYSCKGEGICKKCKLANEDILSCLISVEDYIKYHGRDIFIDYI